MTEPVRVRFAPSPTGKPHVGNIRTAMYDWIFARHTGGKFILRIEDTDVARKKEGALEAIMESLKWLGLDWDEGPEVGGDYGPYFQSQRLELYQKAAKKLVEKGNAYYCYCSPERLEALRKEQEARKLQTGYDRFCRNLSPQERAAKEAAGIKPVVRFKVPEQGQTRFHDLIYGDVVFENSIIDDFVMLKSDGYPTYHLASVVDDHTMKISHVIRDEGWLSSAPRHLLMYKALGYEPPLYVHHPVIVGADRAKLSKRHGAVALLDFRDMGYLPETMFNFLTLIGWSLDDKTEIMTRQQIVENFSIERMGKTGAFFNMEKLDWMNGVYIRGLTIDDLSEKLLPFLDKYLPPEVKRPLDVNYVRQIVPLIRERINTLKDAAAYAEFFFVDKLEHDASKFTDKKTNAETALTALKSAEEILSSLDSFDCDQLENTLRRLAEKLGVKAGQLFNVLRVATTARDATPPLFETMAVLGKERCMKRIKAAISRLGNNRDS
ncbi:MAG: glutamate--tRNA ligase [Dehalococcoidales bacterium]|nr:glutamate--tRNA ligase [Dehalococcoidales bacterium]